MSHYSEKAITRNRPTCPKCGQMASEVRTRFGIRSQCCDLWSWDRYPLVDAETHAARRAAHEAFDQLWMQRVVSRSQAYSLLRKALGITRAKCHMKLMDAKTALRVPEAVMAIRMELAKKGSVKPRRLGRSAR